MITFRHGVSNFENMVLECSGNASDKASSAASALMAAAIGAIKSRKTPRYVEQVEDGYVKIRCAYNQHTAEVANTVICGFDWLAEQVPDEVKVERISSKKV